MTTHPVKRKRRKPALRTRRWVAILSSTMFVGLVATIGFTAPSTASSRLAPTTVTDAAPVASETVQSNTATSPTTTWSASRSYTYTVPTTKAKSHGS